MNTSPGLDRRQPLQPAIAEYASFKLIGLGGVGAIVARYGAMYLASLGTSARLVLIDGDTFEASNGTRMFFSRHGNKAEVTRDDLLPRFADSPLTLQAVPEFVTPQNIERLIRDGDVVVCCVDNHATRKLLSDFCNDRLQEICLISGGNDGVGPDGSGRMLRGTFGNVQVFLRRNGRNSGPTLTRWHPEIANPPDKLPIDLSCSELVASVPQLLIVNLATASAMLNALWLHLCGALHYPELCFDIADGLMRPVPLPIGKH